MNSELEHIYYEKPQIILWEKADTKTEDNHTQIPSARILRVYGNSAEVMIPEIIDGHLVTEIGPYCFSQTAPRKESDQTIYIFQEETRKKSDHTSYKKELPYHCEGARLPEMLDQLPALCGKFLKAVHLPKTVETLHNAAFYNCRFLHTLSVGAAIKGIGSDEFTNCLRLVTLILRSPDHKPSCLPLILERITTDLDIYYLEEDSETSPIVSAIFFPEYYEWLDEVSPAHLFTRTINGEGFRMRKSFLNGLIDYKKYDACMENASKVESPSVLWHISFLRLCFPQGLEAQAREQHLSILKEHYLVGARYFIKEHKLQGLKDLCDIVDPDTTTLRIATDYATEYQWGEGIAHLMERNRPRTTYAKKDFAFDDFDF